MVSHQKKSDKLTVGDVVKYIKIGGKFDRKPFKYVRKILDIEKRHRDIDDRDNPERRKEIYYLFSIEVRPSVGISPYTEKWIFEEGTSAYFDNKGGIMLYDDSSYNGGYCCVERDIDFERYEKLREIFRNNSDNEKDE